MNVLQRKMFAAGDEVLGTRSSGSYLLPKAITTTLSKEGEDFFAIETDAQGNVISKDFIDVNLSPTKDPREAYQRQKTNEALGTVSKVGTAISLLPLAQTKIGGKVVSGIGNLLTKGLGYAPKLSPITATKLPGVALKGQKGFQPLNPLNPMSYKYGVNPVPASVVAGGSLYAGASALQTSEEDVQREIEELQAQSKTDDQEKKDKVAPDPYMGGISDEEIDAVIGADTDAVTEAMAKADYDAEYAQTVRDSITDFQDRYIDNKNMDRFLRNIGKSLVEEGRFTGIATGAVAAAEEKEAERILEAEREADISLASAKAGLKDKPSSKVVTDYKIDLAASAADVEQSELTGQLLDQVENIITTKDITGFSPILQSVYKKALGFAGVQSPLDPRERAIVLLEQIANGNIKTITGESGRTISNVDRQIAQKLIGDLKNPLTREDEILGNLRSQKVDLRNRNTRWKNYRG
jgi:hypothetical protein